MKGRQFVLVICQGSAKAIKLLSVTLAGFKAAILLPLLLAAPVIAQPPKLAVSPGSSLPSVSGGGNSLSPVISRDGRYVLFSSDANNLVTNATGGAFVPVVPARFNVFLRDRTNGTTTLVSFNTNSTGGGNGDSFPVAISTNGQFALFESTATNLVVGDSNSVSDIFVRDVINGVTTLVSVNTNGVPGNGISRSSVMTPDGRYVAFVSAAADLVANDTNGIPDIFVRDLVGGTTVLASVGAISTNTPSLNTYSTSESPDITPDGSYVAFFSTATNLVSGVTTSGEIYVRDLVGGVTTLASTDARAISQSVFGTTNVISYDHIISDDGQFVAYQTSYNSNGYSIMFRPGLVLRYSLITGLTDVVNTNSLGTTFGFEADFRGIDLTPDGRFVTFITNLNNYVLPNAVYVWDAQTASATLASGDLTNGIATNADCSWPQLSSNGRYIAFVSSATNLTTANPLATNYHLYVRDLQSNVTTLVDTRADGSTPVYCPMNAASLSSNGLLIAFESFDPGLVTNDANRSYDVFVRDVSAGTTEMISVPNPALPAASPNGPSYFSTLSFSTNGRYLAFSSEADNLVANDTNLCRDVFVRDLLLGTNVLVAVATNGAPANGPSTDAAISGDGRYVAFTSIASNLVANDNNLAQDVFVRDLQAGNTILISTNMSGPGSANGASYSPIISSDGRYVLFQSMANNLTPGIPFAGNNNLFRRDTQTGATFAFTTSAAINCTAMTPDGRYAAFGGTAQSVVWDMQTTNRIYTNSASPYGIALSPDGKKLAYATSAQVYLVDLAANTNLLLGTSPASNHPVMQFSADDRYLVYILGGTGKTNQVYLFDSLAGTNLLVSESYAAAGNGPSDSPAISSDAHYIAYRSVASNLVPGDTNGLPDIFLYNRLTASNTLVTVSQYGSYSANNRSVTSVFSPDDQNLFFQSWASDLAAGDFNQSSDLFALGLNTSNSFGIAILPPATIVWAAVVGENYQVQFKNDLNDPAWQAFNGSVSLIGNQWMATDPAPAPGQRFYRVLAY